MLAQCRGGDERIGYHGEVVLALEESNLRRAAREGDCRWSGVVPRSFLHGWRHRHHEARACTIAREVGFKHVIASHQVCPLEGFLARSQTILIDAMLTPLLQRSTRSLLEALPQATIEFMQSSGGLARPREFRGSRRAVSQSGWWNHRSGGSRPELRYRDNHHLRHGGDIDGCRLVRWSIGENLESRFDGLRLRVPMLEIDTIAAGGGSICRFDGQRMRVGPESAGADPGPACYRMGGPATLTDCQMVLGRLDQDLLLGRSDHCVTSRWTWRLPETCFGTSSHPCRV